jgi:hypothetical protein
MLNKFFQPKSQNWRWALCLSSGIYFYLFVLLFSPFKGFQQIHNSSTSILLINSGINNVLKMAICAFFLILLPKYFPQLFTSEKFTHKRLAFFVFSIVFNISLVYFCSINYLYHIDSTPSWFMQFMFTMAFPSILFIGTPFIISFFLIFNYFTNEPKEDQIWPPQYLPSNTETAKPFENINRGTPPQYKTQTAAVQTQLLRFTDNSSKKTYEIALESLYYITSDHNYIEVHYKNEQGNFSRLVLRNSLKTIEDEMIGSARSPLIRCHKAFIVNQEKIASLHGPTKLAYFILTGIETHIPISRQKYPDLEPRFLNSNVRSL